MPIIFRIDNGTASRAGSRSRGGFRPFRIAAFIVFGLSFLILLSSILGDGGLVRVYQMSQDKRELQSKITREEERQRELLVQIKSSKEDPFELERVAREELGMVKAEETVYDFREAGPP